MLVFIILSSFLSLSSDKNEFEKSLLEYFDSFLKNGFNLK